MHKSLKLIAGSLLIGSFAVAPAYADDGHHRGRGHHKHGHGHGWQRPHHNHVVYTAYPYAAYEPARVYYYEPPRPARVVYYPEPVYSHQVYSFNWFTR